jgi:ferric enterobactin receptor
LAFITLKNLKSIYYSQMKKSILLILFLAFANFAYSQRPGGGGYGKVSKITGKITGIVIDSASSEVLPFVSLVLKNTQTKKDVSGGITEDDGSFKLQDVPVGKYQLLLSFVGYKTKTISIEMSLKKPDVSLGNIILVSTTTTLDEVTVEGSRAIIESKIDRLIYNAKDDVANAGGDAADVLRRAPLLNVDLEGNVSLRGSTNIQILINGKPSTILASSPADALKIIPADQIERVEVITSPSAKYDAEGTAGIVNIITKKKNAEGVAGNINLTAGNLSQRAVAGITAGRGRFGFNANGSVFYSLPRDGETSFLREDFIGSQTRLLSENGINESGRLGFFATAGAYYDFNAFHSLSSNFRLRGFRSDRDGNFLTNYNDPINNVIQQYNRGNDSRSLRSGYEWSLDYTMKFPNQKDREMSLSYKIDGNVSESENDISQNDLIGNDTNLFRDENNRNDGTNRESTIQLDYTHPVNKKMKLETGVRAVIRDINTDSKYFAKETAEDPYLFDVSQSNVLNYDQDVMAGYVSTNISFTKKLGLIAGVRYEHTEIAGFFEESSNSFANDYDNWLPSITLSQKIGKMNTLKFSFNQRIQRPSLRFINPFRDVSNNRNITQGNPDLEPELNSQYEVSYNTFLKGVLVNLSTYYRKTTDIIENILIIDNEGIATTTYQNVGENNSFGLNLFTSATLFKIWTLRGGFNLYTYDGSGQINGETVSRQAVIWNGNINSNLKLKKDWVIDLFGFYRAPRQTLQGTYPSFSLMSIGVRKQIWEKRASIGLRIVEPFFANKEFGSDLESELFRQSSLFSIPFRSVGINFSCKFGKLDYNKRSRRSKIKNDDQKSGSDGQNQF